MCDLFFCFLFLRVGWLIYRPRSSKVSVPDCLSTTTLLVDGLTRSHSHESNLQYTVNPERISGLTRCECMLVNQKLCRRNCLAVICLMLHKTFFERGHISEHQLNIFLVTIALPLKTFTLCSSLQFSFNKRLFISNKSSKHVKPTFALSWLWNFFSRFVSKTCFLSGKLCCFVGNIASAFTCISKCIMRRQVLKVIHVHFLCSLLFHSCRERKKYAKRQTRGWSKYAEKTVRCNVRHYKVFFEQAHRSWSIHFHCNWTN